MQKSERAITPKIMPRVLALSLLGLAVLSGGAARAQQSAERTGPDSFLMYQVESTEELAAVLRADPVLRKRYAKHFNVSEDQVVSFVERALVPYRLPADRTLTTYGVTKDGRIYPVRTRLRRGTRVWATRSGIPILKWLCANPFTKTLPGEDLPPPQASKPRIGANVAELPVQEVMGETLPPTAIAAVPDTTLVGTAVATASEVQPSVLVAPSVQEFGGANLGALGLAFVPFLLDTGDETPPGEIIPEPGTIALVALGALPIGMAIRRRRRADQ